MSRMIRLTLCLVIITQLGACAALLIGGVAATGAAVHDRRSVGTVIDDRVLRIRVGDALYSHDSFDGSTRIKISAYNGWVLLAGEALDQERVTLASEIVTQVDGVRRLFNELAPIDAAGIGQGSSDKWISSRVKASLTGIRDLPGFDATRVRVTTARGIVYLQGLIHRDEADTVVEQVRTVRGVERVITLFEFREDQPGPVTG